MSRIFKKVQVKKTREINQFHEILFCPNPIFAISKMAKNQFLNWGKSLNCQKCNFKNGQKSIFELGKKFKLPKMRFHEKKIHLLDFTSFLFIFGRPAKNKTADDLQSLLQSNAGSSAVCKQVCKQTYRVSCRRSGGGCSRRI